ncbi:hypothetical protein A2635_05485 [Candidatus Peribacteria bacterium RIFCSPHIGHO2_01_FULL_51_9]|nr:MAG: hypothetical protein A2635_05485 [Candidatus Peribacteria bacterium RIFCSPHIGHO2_01_FULL_51_9]
MAAAWLALSLCLPQYRPRRSWVLGAFALFVVVIGVADAFGAYPFKSMWSNYERMEGWVTLAHLLAYVVVAVSVLNTENLWRRLFQWSLFVSLCLSLLGVLQVFGIFSSAGGTSGLSGRVAATFGNPIYLAAYMLFHIFIAGMLFAQMLKVREAGRRLAPALFYGGVIGLDTLALLLTGTRGAMLGLLGGAFLTLVLLSLAPGSRRLRRITIGAFIGLIVAGGALWAARDSAFVNSVGFLGRLASISLTDNTTKARFLNMGIAWEGVKERPILGWGQENYALVFDKYYDPRMYAQEQWFDRVHDSIFDWWIAGGTLGLLAFLGVFGAALWVLWRASLTRRTDDAFTHEERSILTGLLAAYFVHNLTVFDNITSSILFATVLAYIAYREMTTGKTAPLLSRALPSRALLFAAPLCAALLALVVWGINANAYAANRALIGGMQPQEAGLEYNLTLFEKAVSYDTYGTQEAREQLAQIAVQILASNQVPTEIKQRFTATAVSELEKQAALSPLDARFPLFAASVLSAAGDYKNAATLLEKARQLSPGKQTILYELGQNAYFRGDADAAVRYFEEAYKLAEDNVVARIYYAMVLIRLGRDEEAERILAPIIPTGQAADQRILAAYVEREQYGKLIPLWEARVEAVPTDVQAYFTLGAAYYVVGERAQAIATLERAALLGPEVKAQTDPLILQIQSGTLKVQ